MESLFSWLIERRYSPCCSGVNRRTLKATGRHCAQHCSQSVKSHCIGIHKHHISQPELKNPLEGVNFFHIGKQQRGCQRQLNTAPYCQPIKKLSLPKEWWSWLWYSINYHCFPLSLLSFPAYHFYKTTQIHNSVLTTKRCVLALEQYLLQHKGN